MYILMTKGLKQSVCDQSFYNGPVSKFWAYAFVLSKAPELGKLGLYFVTSSTYFSSLSIDTVLELSYYCINNHCLHPLSYRWACQGT